ncbi:MAG: 50S ribosomal protein L9 [Bacteroidetes bacterium]|nr:50S ribosomal protein L9 [Bacteroidota bacterium]
MEIILNTDIPKLGYKGDVVSVKPGYARNFLIPRGMAMVANSSNLRSNQENLKQQANKIARILENAQALANKLSAEEVVVTVKTGTSGKLFGSVTTLQIANLLKEKGYDVDRRNVSFAEPIKEVGNHKAQVECYKNIVAEVSVVVKGEDK